MNVLGFHWSLIFLGGWRTEAKLLIKADPLMMAAASRAATLKDTGFLCRDTCQDQSRSDAVAVFGFRRFREAPTCGACEDMSIIITIVIVVRIVLIGIP